MEEKIVFPVGDETAQALKDKALSDNDVSEVSGGANASCFVYNTRPGDTLRKIAARFATTTYTLMELNQGLLVNLKEDDVIMSGTKVLVPMY